MSQAQHNCITCGTPITPSQAWTAEPDGKAHGDAMDCVEGLKAQLASILKLNEENASIGSKALSDKETLIYAGMDLVKEIAQLRATNKALDERNDRLARECQERLKAQREAESQLETHLNESDCAFVWLEQTTALEEKVAALQSQLVTAKQEAFQNRVQPWMMACFGEAISSDKTERNYRFLEEALELVQACGCTQEEAHQLVDYVFDRPAGEPIQEVGGVMVTLAALCLAQGLSMDAAGEIELERIWTKIEQIRAKQAAKPRNSPLPASKT